MQVRVNIRRVKQLVWLLCALTFVYAGYSFYEIYSDKMAGKYSPRKSLIFEELLKKNVNLNSLNQRSAKDVFYKEDRYKHLWDALVDGSKREIASEESQEAPPKPPAFVVPDLATIVDIGLVVYSASAVERFVALSYLADGAKPGPVGTATPSVSKEVRLHLSEGDPLKAPYDVAPYNGKVLRIGLQEVVFQWGEPGTEVTLNPGLGTEGTGQTIDQFSVSPREDPTAGIEKAPDESLEVQPGHWVMGTRDLDRMKGDPQVFMSEELNVHSVTAQGGRTGLEVSEVKEGSLAAKYGVQAGDKIISVNGFPMTSVSAAINWAKANPDLPEYVVQYEHAGQLKTVTIHVK